MTFFSVLIPTRNRPQFLVFALESLKRQSFQDFEVIISENSDDHQEGLKLVEAMNDTRFRAVVPDKPLNMHDNWNFALSHAKGQYVTVMGDKKMMLSGAFQKVYAILQKDPQVEIISWMSDWYSFADEDQGWHGFYQTQEDIYRPTLYNSKKELKLRLGHYIKNEELQNHYLRGHIHHGFYASRLIERIIGCVGRLFHPLSPDYTSLALGLIFSHKSCDVGQSLELACNSRLSTATMSLADPYFLAKVQPSILEESFEDFLKHLPIPGINYGHTNSIAYDLCEMIKISGKEKLLKHLNIDSLFLRVMEEAQDYSINLQEILIKYNAEHHLKWLKTKKFIDMLKRVTSEFKRVRFIDRILIKIAQCLPEDSFLGQRRQQRLSGCYQTPCADPLQGLEFGHAHYKKFKFLEYK